VRSGSIDIAGFQLAYTDLLTEKAADARLSLAAMVTEDTTLALGKRDKTAVVVANKARAAVNYQKAAEAIDRGDFGAAKRSLQANDSILFEGDEVAGKGAMDEERATNSAIYGLSTSAPAASPEQRREAVKQMKTESLRSSGRGASLY